jgi:hypothetical protein
MFGKTNSGEIKSNNGPKSSARCVGSMQSKYSAEGTQIAFAGAAERQAGAWRNGL